MFRVEQMKEWQGRVEPALRGAWHWWLAEMVSFVPARLRRWIASLRSRLLFVIDGSGPQLAYETGERRETLGRVDLKGDVAAAIRRVLAAATPRVGQARDLVICLPAERGLRTSVTLPLAAEANLDQVIGFEFERLVPFKKEEVYYAHRIAGRNKLARTLQIELTVVPRSEVEELLRDIRRAGLHVIGLEIAAGRPDSGASRIMFEGVDRAVAYPRARLALASIAALFMVLAVAAIAIPFAAALRTRESLSAEVAAARSQAEASLNLQKQIDAETQDRRFLITRRRDTPTVTELLDTITRLTPDDTWLTELQITGSEVHLVGASASATVLLGLVDQSPSFRDAAFRSSVTQDSRIGRERFDISAHIAPRSGK